MKVIIIGAVAAGAGAAARLRRLDESAEIILLDKGQNMSYANCGLPYHLGKVIPQRETLLVMPPEKFNSWFNIDVRLQSEAVAIDRANKAVTILNRGENPAREYTESYDYLVIAAGSTPALPSLPGVNGSRVLPLWTLSDMDKIESRLASARRVTVLGAGFVGLETAENLRKRGIETTIVVRSQILAPFDKEMTAPLLEELAREGIVVEQGVEPTGFEETESGVTVLLSDGRRLESDLAILSLGVKPNSSLAQKAGLELGAKGHIIVSDTMQTSDECIYAAGDAVEVLDPILGGKTAIALAGPANKQGRIAADNIAGRHSVYPGSYGASIIKVGALTAAHVGLSEKQLAKASVEYQCVYLHPLSNAGYYPGAARLDMKLLFSPEGKIFGAQIVGAKGADKRIDDIAAVMEMGKTVFDLSLLETAYAPPYNSAKDPVNFAGMIASNVIKGESQIVHANAIPADAVVVDVREAAEYELGCVPGAINVPLGAIRENLNRFDKSKLTVVYCQVGLRGYLAERILRQNGYNVRNLSGGYLTWKMFHPMPIQPARFGIEASAPVLSELRKDAVDLDVRALPCPGPIIKIKKYFDELQPGEQAVIQAQAGFAPDLQSWAASSRNELISLKVVEDELRAVIRKSGGANAACPAGNCSSQIIFQEKSGAIVLFSNDLDKVTAAFIIACGMAASGMKVGIFFTFWGLSALRKNPAPVVKKSFIARMFGWMLPKGAGKLTLSKMNMGGMGTAMMKQVMSSQNVPSLPELIQNARDLGVKFIACEMAMNVMGITREELIDIDEVAGVARFVELSRNSSSSLFI